MPQNLPQPKRNWLGNLVYGATGAIPPEKWASMTEEERKEAYRNAIGSAALSEIAGQVVLPLTIAGGARLLSKVIPRIPGARALGQFLKSRFVQHWDIIQFPELREHIRQLEAAPEIALVDAAKEVANVTKGLSREEKKLFAKIAIDTDILATALEGKRIPYRYITPDPTKSLQVNQLEEYLALQKSFQESMQQINPKITDALIAHKQLTEKYAEILRKRGFEIPERDWYFPHKIKDYESYYRNWFWTESPRATIGKRLRKPFRGMTKMREGSTRAIEEDYERVMLDHIARINLDNKIEDFVIKTAQKYDIFPELEADEVQALFPEGYPEAGVVYQIGNKLYKGWVPEFNRRLIYRANTLTESTLNSLMDEIVDLRDAEKVAGKTAREVLEEYLKPVLAIGKKRKAYLLEQPIAKKLDSFRQGSRSTAYYSIANKMRLWKALVLGTAGIPYHATNFFGDMLNLFREDPAAVAKLPAAVKALLRSSPTTQRLMEFAEGRLPRVADALRQPVKMSKLIRTGQEAGVLQGGAYAELGTGRWAGGHLNPLNWVETIGRYRENLPRLAKLIADAERIERGESVIARTIDIEGLTARDAAFKVAREALVDYGGIKGTDLELLRDFFFPFITWYVKNAENWAKYVIANPADFVVRFGFPRAALEVWNNMGERAKVENSMPEWLRFLDHLNSGFKDKNGKDIVFALQTPENAALDMFGLDSLPAIITDMQKGRLDIEEGIKKVLSEITMGPIENAAFLMTPVARFVLGVYSGKDPVSKYQVVDPKQVGLPRWWRQVGIYLMQTMFAPYAQWKMHAARVEKGTWEGLPRPLSPYAGIGYRAIDTAVEKEKRKQQVIHEKTAKHAEEMDKLEDVLLKALLEGKKIPLEQYSPRDIKNVLRRPSFQRKYLEKRGELTPEERQALEKRTTQRLLKQAPVTTRGEILQTWKKRQLED